MPARYITYNLCIKNDTHGVGGTTSSYPKYRLLRDDSVLGAQTTSSVHRQYRHQHMMLHCFCDPSSVWPMGITYDIDYATIPVRLMSSSLRSSYLYRRLPVIPPSSLSSPFPNRHEASDTSVTRCSATDTMRVIFNAEIECDVPCWHRTYWKNDICACN